MNRLDGEEVEGMKNEKESNSIYELCKNHLHAYVLAEMVDGTAIDGIITGLDDENVYFAIPIDHQDEQIHHSNLSQRQFGGGYGYGYGPGPGFGYGYPAYGYPRRRFRRLILPLTALAALSLLPWY